MLSNFHFILTQLDEISIISLICSEKAMAPHSSTLAWQIPWTQEPGRLQSMGSLRVGHNWATSLSLFTFLHWRRKWQPTPVVCLENPRDGGAWWAAVYGVAQSRTRLKQLSSSSSSSLICWGFPGGSDGKASACNVGDLGLIPRSGRCPWRRKLATHFSTLAWKIPWTEEPSRL